jgi:putative ATPase
MSLFAKVEADAIAASAPLAERMRPRSLEEFAGQQALLGPGKPLRVAIETDDLGSMILWGPPGCGKTTLARLIARRTHSEFVSFSAVLTGIREIKDVMAAAEHSRRSGRRTIVFVDEVHRFNKAQQDAFLPHVEAGNIIFIGATTENPSFEVIAPLLSRTRVYTLQALTNPEIIGLLRRALSDKEHGYGTEKIEAREGVLERMAIFANGDARAAYNTLEALVRAVAPGADGARVLTEELLSAALQRKFLLYDKSGEEHYNLISALHKSVRNSDADAALYWLARMLESGEDPLYIARRLVRMASEDIGLADPAALGIAVAAMQAADFVGVPEGNLALAQAAVYLALAPKSNALYTGYDEAQKDLQNTAAEPVPLHLRNAATGLMRHEGYGRGYQYAHDVPDKVADMKCLPPSLADRRYYQPGEEGFEQRLRERMEEIRGIKTRRASGTGKA